jgi:phage host-nuclease inhibitor protein Gam
MSAKTKLIKALKGPAISTRDEATAIAAATAALIIERDKIQAIRNEKVEETSLGYAVQLDELNSKIKTNEKALIAWAIKNREVVFANSKTIGLAGHKLALREGTGKVGTTEEVTEEEVIDALINSDDESLAERFITVKPALDKNAILTVLRAGGETARILEGFGLKLVKEEKCKFEPDLDAAPSSTVESIAAA